ncbi:MAG: trigger factor [Candidatus Fraserbacteria bacterium RBG_16_55_9]|uniref:Trigger factor n=1 Tax=Fraserbacteria sp. (strain RBG_16_55_9) TaxID=1817864 RepID=A0A1F5UNZ3_FRAXR|nr:MAG: trigger factor [Candidatus Fraserbacteria bacterium RBG_16_55_9]
MQEKSKTQCVIQVEVPLDVVEQKLEEMYRRVVRTLELPGFRKGHIPRAFLLVRFGKDFLYEDSKAELLETYLPQALSEHKIEPASRPEPRIVEFEAGKPFRFEIDVEVFPEVEVPDYSDLKVEAPSKRRVTPKEVDRVVEELRVEHATLVPKPRTAVVEADDVIVIRQRGGQTREIQARSEGWTASLLGKRTGETLEIDASEGSKLKVTIDGIKRIELPDRKELAKTLGHKDTKSMEEDIREKLKERHKQDHEQELRIALLDAVVERSQVKVPARLVDDLLKEEREVFRKGGRELSEEESAKLREVIEQRLKRDRVLQAIKKKEKIEISDKQLEELIQQEAERRGTNLVKFKALLEREGRLEGLRQDRENQQALDFLVEKAEVIERSPNKPKQARGKARDPQPEEQED